MFHYTDWQKRVQRLWIIQVFTFAVFGRIIIELNNISHHYISWKYFSAVSISFNMLGLFLAEFLDKKKKSVDISIWLIIIVFPLIFMTAYCNFYLIDHIFVIKLMVKKYQVFMYYCISSLITGQVFGMVYSILIQNIITRYRRSR